MDTLHGVRRVLLIGAAGEEIGAGPVTLTDHSVTSATGASQALLAANASRRSLSIVNPPDSATDWVINPLGGTAVAGTMPCFTLHPGDEWNPVPAPANAITGLGVAASELIVLEG